MAKSTASISTAKDFVILKSQKINTTIKLGVYPVYVRGVSKCCIDKNEVQQITPIVIPSQK
jgi:hypothetical protein